ncbi:mannosyltransferase [Schizosaccharomyces japonicus yFS275]|uniref:Mannosyltransferase n=1 Tax=Schizosaccharomyces japonicus (strain yFS275 / FY16936) TaxID=402676 RepID=B6K830_SCHJY|nr:mannosyltransferase [Schizosaccharomyces japonicus yFS275]EEB09684.2 mannosyltransferase [Schizosaccharomyces japonicus yFS275]
MNWVWISSIVFVFLAIFFSRKEVTYNDIFLFKRPVDKPDTKASFLVFTNDAELTEVLHSIRSIEDRFNNRFHYPWTFVSQEGFSEAFINYTISFASGDCNYVTAANIELPLNNIDNHLLEQGMAKSQEENISYPDSVSFRNYNRWLLNTFLRNDFLQNFDVLWRIEPGIEIHCDIRENLFQSFLASNMYAAPATYECEFKHQGIYELEKAFIAVAEQNKLQINRQSLWISENTTHYCKLWPYNGLIRTEPFQKEKSIRNTLFQLVESPALFYNRWTESDLFSLTISRSDVSSCLYNMYFTYDTKQRCNSYPEKTLDRCACPEKIY